MDRKFIIFQKGIPGTYTNTASLSSHPTSGIYYSIMKWHKKPQLIYCTKR